jgi:hypothetical protein
MPANKGLDARIRLNVLLAVLARGLQGLEETDDGFEVLLRQLGKPVTGLPLDILIEARKLSHAAGNECYEHAAPVGRVGFAPDVAFAAWSRKQAGRLQILIRLPWASKRF